MQVAGVHGVVFNVVYSGSTRVHPASLSQRHACNAPVLVNKSVGKDMNKR
jgi:hypothetical protein